MSKEEKPKVETDNQDDIPTLVARNVCNIEQLDDKQYDNCVTDMRKKLGGT